VLVNPGVALATRDVFARLKVVPQASALAHEAVPRELTALIGYLKQHGNDLTDAAIICAPVVGNVLKALEAQPGVLLARMSGSGSTCFALFTTAAEAETAAEALSSANPEWWARATVFGTTS
jgi:4-diphosphocytidyl-2-C-methyl-D-erythritol kinase